MTAAAPYYEIRPTSVAREQLSALLSRFRREGATAEPMFFGSHRKAEGVVLPFELYQAVAEPIAEAREAALLQERINDGKPRISLEAAIENLGFSTSEFDL